MSTELYMELPEDFLDYLAPMRREDIEPAELYALALSMTLHGWQDSYIHTHTGITPQTLAAYRKVGLQDYDLPFVPEPHPDSPHITHLRSIYTPSARPHFVTDLTPTQIEELQSLYQNFRAAPYFRHSPSAPPIQDQPKWHAMEPLAHRLMIYYSLGISPDSLTEYMTNYEQTINTATYRIIKGYYQWLTPSLATTNQTTFSSIYSPRISTYLLHLTDFLNPSKENSESPSLTDFCTPFGTDLTAQKHLFRRKSYRQLFGELPEKVTVLTPDTKSHFASFEQALADADPAYAPSSHSRSPLT